MDNKEKEKVTQFIKESKAGYDLDDIIEISDIIIKYRDFASQMKKLLKEYENIDKKYTYMITFTIDPKKHNVDDLNLHDSIEEYIISFAEAREPVKADLVKEGTDEDHKHTHWHLGLETKKYIDFSNFLKFYRKTYGKVDISKSWSNCYNNILKYINKSVPSQQLA